MSDKLKINVTKLVTDGSNWVTYHNRMLWAIKSCSLSKHLTKTSITQAYKDMGEVGTVLLEMRWCLDQATVKQLIAMSIPDSVFNNIKTGTSAKDVWDALKKLYEGHTTLIPVDLKR